jgi:ABC-type dipeptide/oligopeptide/nickel transport system permease component
VSTPRFAARRIATFPLQILGAVTMIFLVIHALPGSPVFHQLGLYQTPQLVAKLTHQLGLGRPLIDQYGSFLSGLIHGNLGHSFVTSNPVTTDLTQLFPATLELALASLFVGLLVGGLFGVVSGLRSDGAFARGTSAYRLVAGAVPEFLIGLVLIYVFVSVLKIAPGPTGQLDAQLDPGQRITGMVVVDSLLAGNLVVFRSAIDHLALPALALGLSAGGPIARLLRIVIADARESDYVQYAQLAGLRRSTVAFYVVRSAMVPLITLLAVLSVLLIGQSVPVEIVFSWGGLGQYAVQAVQISDYAAVQGVVIATTTFVLFVYLVADLAQAILDPRLRAAPRKGRARRLRLAPIRRVGAERAQETT